MNRLDRALGILLLLRAGKSWSAAALAKHFEVSPRTIYRDVETLSLVGVPVYAEMGRAGGFRLMEGYFLPPVMFSVGEAISILIGLTIVRQLRVKPFAAELETVEQKLLAAVPDHLRATLAHTQRVLGFESFAPDVFHIEQANPGHAISAEREGEIIATFLQAILDRKLIALRYQSPYGAPPQNSLAAPRGVLWDRDRWYLVGARREHPEERRLWRADRVQALTPSAQSDETRVALDVGAWLGRAWLRTAMEQWIAQSPVTIRVTRAQAARLKQDWYYRHAHYTDDGEQHTLMTLGEDQRAIVFDLLRWLGPQSELIEPRAWRAEFRAELEQMLARYTDD